MKMQKQRNLLCFCICFASFAFFLVPLLHLTRQQYLLYPPRKKAEKSKTNAKKSEKSDKYAQLQFFFFVCFTCCFFLLCFCFFFWLLVSMAGVPDTKLDLYILQKFEEFTRL